MIEIENIDGGAGPLVIREEEISGRELVLGAGEYQDWIVRSTVRDSTINMVTPSLVRFTHTYFQNCVFKPKKKVQTVWVNCAWDGCVFHGRYVSTHFGILRMLRDSNPWGDIIVKNCDYSQTTLHGCVFRLTDVATVTFPKWPCFTLLNPKHNYPTWQETLSSIMPHFLSVWCADAEGTVALVLHWPTLARELKIDVSEEELKKKMLSLENILL